VGATGPPILEAKSASEMRARFVLPLLSELLAGQRHADWREPIVAVRGARPVRMAKNSSCSALGDGSRGKPLPTLMRSTERSGGDFQPLFQ